MENRIVKFKSKESGTLNLHAIPGHFATTHSHINYYVDMTFLKSRKSHKYKDEGFRSEGSRKNIADEDAKRGLH